MTTDTSERGLESLICTALTGSACDPAAGDSTRERPSAYGAGWTCGDPKDYDREFCLDLAQLAAFLRATQPEVAESLRLGQDGPTRRRFLARLQGEITKRGTIDVLRKGIKRGPHQIDLLYGTPSPGNERARALIDRTASASRGSCATAGTRPSFPWTWACSSTACRSPPSS